LIKRPPHPRQLISPGNLRMTPRALRRIDILRRRRGHRPRPAPNHHNNRNRAPPHQSRAIVPTPPQPLAPNPQPLNDPPTPNPHPAAPPPRRSASPQSPQAPMPAPLPRTALRPQESESPDRSLSPDTTAMRHNGSKRTPAPTPSLYPQQPSPARPS